MDKINIIESNIKDTEEKIQYILDEKGELTEIPRNKCKPVEHPIKYNLKNAFEVFVRIAYTENYWISNYGRCINNLNHKDKNTFYKHKEGKCHYTIYEIEKILVSYPIVKQNNGKFKVNKTKEKTEMGLKSGISEEEINHIIEEMQKANPKRSYSVIAIRHKYETSPEELVACNFLVKYNGRSKIWHKDGDDTNNWYKNLLYVSKDDYIDLKAGKVTWQELNLEQEYIEYENKAGQTAYKIYNGIKARCKDTTVDDRIRACYDKSTMWQGWVDDPKSFVKWYLEHSYEVDGEEMDVDKDLFGDDSGMYHPNFCCLLPKGLNTLLANSKKHYLNSEPTDNVLPYGVRYNSKNNKYFSEIQLTGTQKKIRLSEHDTPKEAFAEYKRMKEADILLMAAKYKGRIPDYIYDKLLTIEVKPY